MLVRHRWLRLMALAGCLLAVAGPSRAQLRWQSFVHGGETWCLAARADEIWAGTSAGLRVYRTEGGRVQVRELTLQDNLPAGAVSAIAFEPDGVWVGTRTGIAARLDLETNAWQVYDQQARFPVAPVTGFASDGQDLWAATAGGGLARFNPLRRDWQVWDRQEGLPDSTVRCLAGDAEGLWAGTEHGLLRYLRETLTWQPVTAKQGLSGRIDDLAATSRNVWVCGPQDGLARIRLATGELLRYDLTRYGVARVLAVEAAADGTVWVATEQGLLSVPDEDEGQATWAFAQRPLTEVTGLLVREGAVWLGTRQQGLLRYVVDSGAWEAYEPVEVLPSGQITSLAAQGGIGWVGFADRAVARYDLALERWETLTPPAGLPRQVREVAAYGNQVYCACADGIAVYRQRERTWTALRQAEHHELLGDEWTSVVATAERVWFAGPGRVAMFDAELDLLATFEFPNLEADRDGTLPRLRLDEASGDVWAVGRWSVWRYQARANVWGEFAADLFRADDPGAAQRDGRLVRSLALDNDAAWFVAGGRVLQYRKQLNQLWAWDGATVPGLGEPQLVAADRFAVWVAGATGLHQFHRQSESWQAHPWSGAGLDGAVATALAVDPEEPAVWVATNRGVARLDVGREAARWQVFGPGAGIVPGVRRIVSTPVCVWFAGEGGVTLYRRPRPE